MIFVCPRLEMGGAERQWGILISGLAKRGFQPIILSLTGEGPVFDELRSKGIATFTVGMRRRTDVRGWKRALGFVGMEPDLVISLGVSAQVVGQALAWRARAPHINTSQQQPGLRMRRYRELLTRSVSRFANAIAVTDQQVDDLVRLGFNRHRINVIPNGVFAATRSTRPPDDVRAELGLADSDFLALLVAKLRPEKNVPLFIEAVALAHRRDNRVHGIVVGDGPELVPVMSESNTTNGVVRAIGSRDDVADLMGAADVVCLSSSFEAVPMALIEAMAQGRPTIATRVGAVEEVVVPGDTGLVVPPGDLHAFAAALLELCHDDEKRARLGEAARRRQREHFDAEKMIDQYVDVFTDVWRVHHSRR